MITILKLTCFNLKDLYIYFIKNVTLILMQATLVTFHSNP